MFHAAGSVPRVIHALSHVINSTDLMQQNGKYYKPPFKYGNTEA